MIVRDEVLSLQDSIMKEYYLPKDIKSVSKYNKSGELRWVKHGLELDYAFKKIGSQLVRKSGKEVFQQDYMVDPILKWEVSFYSEKTIRLKLFSNQLTKNDHDSLMINEPLNEVDWDQLSEDDKYIFTCNSKRVEINNQRFEFSLYNNDEQLLKTIGLDDNKGLHQKFTPLSFIKDLKTDSVSFAFSHTLSTQEKIYGCGESFKRLDKNGQRIKLCMADVQSSLTADMYKPIPFYISDKGYGLFIHSSTPMEFDIGCTHNSTSTLIVEDEVLDIFFILGSYKEIIKEYTQLTGRSPFPPIWSFGLWMSRLSYKSKAQVIDVAMKLREMQMPCDVIHIDARWFQNGMNCDFKFGPLFENPKEMITKLTEFGFRTSLWQIPYFNKSNSLYNELINKELVIKQSNSLTNDVILDFSNDETKKWYSSKIQPLLDLGVSVIKADFGEEAPLNGIYSSGQSGYYEHNLYPLRYNSLLFNLIKEKSKDTILWSRSSWAGGQRFPIHWSGDSEISNEAMLSTLRAGLSLGICGFTFWSHDIGGFSGSTYEDLFLRWTFMGMFTSHSRIHGLPPREPWFFNKDFQDNFRFLIEMRYRLLPYIITESQKSALNGLPLLRAMFLEFEEDKTCKYLEDQYMFGTDILIAPFFQDNINSRYVYLPKGVWVDYFTNKTFKGGTWQRISSLNFGIALVKLDSVIPHVELAQSTVDINWSKIEYRIYNKNLIEIETDLYNVPLRKFSKIQINKNDSGNWENSTNLDDKLHISVKQIKINTI
ncbi:MAG: alpha-xylosidase [Winogradskyella sp.]